MKKISRLLIAATIACIGLSSPAVANNDNPSKKAFSVASVRNFDRYSTILAKAKLLPVSTQKTSFTNSSLKNSRPSGYDMIIPVFAITYNTWGTTDYYYTDNCFNGTTVYFTVPNISGINQIQLFQLGQNFHNWEWSTLYSNSGAYYISGDADLNGNNWITYWDGNGPFSITNGMDVEVF